MIYSLNKYSRIKKTFEYDYVLQNGITKYSCFWKVVFITSMEIESRIGLAISKKTYKKACERNLKKRLIKETFRTQKQNFKKLDIIVSAKKSKKIPNKILVEDLNNLFKNISNI